MALHPSGPQRPLPQLLAFDLAATALSLDAEPDVRLLLIGSTEAMAEDILARCEWPITILTDSAATYQAVQAAADRVGGGRVTVTRVSGSRSEPAGALRSGRALWVAPDRSNWRTGAAIIDQYLGSGGRLAVISNGPLSVLRALLRRAEPGVSPGRMDPREIADALGYQTLASWRLYGLPSLAWAVLRLTADRLSRPDMADRFEAAFRLSLPGNDTRRLWSTGIWVGQRPDRE